MERIILGLLMLRGMSIYEMKAVIDAKLSTMCSSSAGSIHAAIKQLMAKEFIQCTQDGKRKVYFITSYGRTEFTEWIAKPMNHDKAKNIEISKFFFMGMVEQEKVTGLVVEYIKSLQEEMAIMQTILEASTQNKPLLLEQSKQVIESDLWNEEGIKKNLMGRSMNQTIQDIYKYQMELVQYTLDSLQFEINWYQEFLNRNK